MAMASAEALKHSGKDVHDELNATCVGVRLENGTRLAVPPPRCLAIILSVLALAECDFSTSKDVQAVLGTMQWFDLLQRGKLSVYDKIYAFVGNCEDAEIRHLPAVVLEDLLLGALLRVFWAADLTREFLPKLFASDASVEFGFGASYVDMPSAEVRKVARLAEKQGDFVVLDGAPMSAHKSRLGQASSTCPRTPLCRGRHPVHRTSPRNQLSRFGYNRLGRFAVDLKSSVALQLQYPLFACLAAGFFFERMLNLSRDPTWQDVAFVKNSVVLVFNASRLHTVLDFVVLLVCTDSCKCFHNDTVQATMP
eukprot:s3897_g8.t1